jgi:preprotein translocase subunit SecG
MLLPGESPPAEGSEGSGSSSSSSSNSSSGSSGLSKGAIAGIAVAGVVFLGILVALFFLLGRNRVYKQWMSSQDGRTERTARWALFNHPNGGPEVASNAGKPPMTDTTSVSSPDPGRYNTMSPPLGDGVSSYGPSSPRQQSGHWSWDPSFNTRNARGPSELEATNIIHQLPESSHER